MSSTSTKEQPEEKAKQLVDKHGSEKALKIVNGMINIAIEYDEEHDVSFYQSVKQHIQNL